MKIFIGNLAPEVTEEDLGEAAKAYGEIGEVTLSVDKKGASKGFGFVEMDSAEEGEALIKGLNGQELKGQAVRVNASRPEGRISGKTHGGWSGLGGRNLNKTKGKVKADGGKGYGGGHVGSREG